MAPPGRPGFPITYKSDTACFLMGSCWFLVSSTSKPPVLIPATIYLIPSSSCNSVYVGKAGRGLTTRLREHQRDLTSNNTPNALVEHAKVTGHYPNWTSAKNLRVTSSRIQRKPLEAAMIQTQTDTLNTSPGGHILGAVFTWLS